MSGLTHRHDTSGPRRSRRPCVDASPPTPRAVGQAASASADLARPDRLQLVLDPLDRLRHEAIGGDDRVELRAGVGEQVVGGEDRSLSSANRYASAHGDEALHLVSRELRRLKVAKRLEGDAVGVRALGGHGEMIGREGGQVEANSAAAGTPRGSAMARVGETWARDGGRCVWCGASPWERDRTIEHLLPRSRAGTSASCNLLPACRSCNRARRSRSPPPTPASGPPTAATCRPSCCCSGSTACASTATIRRAPLRRAPGRRGARLARRRASARRARAAARLSRRGGTAVRPCGRAVPPFPGFAGATYARGPAHARHPRIAPRRTARARSSAATASGPRCWRSSTAIARSCAPCTGSPGSASRRCWRRSPADARAAGAAIVSSTRARSSRPSAASWPMWPTPSGARRRRSPRRSRARRPRRARRARRRHLRAARSPRRLAEPHLRPGAAAQRARPARRARAPVERVGPRLRRPACHARLAQPGRARRRGVAARRGRRPRRQPRGPRPPAHAAARRVRAARPAGRRRRGRGASTRSSRRSPASTSTRSTRPRASALDAASVVRRTTLSLLDAMLPGEPAAEAFGRLRGAALRRAGRRTG